MICEERLLAARSQAAAHSGYKIIASACSISAGSSRENVAEICRVRAIPVNRGQFSRAAAKEIPHAIDNARERWRSHARSTKHQPAALVVAHGAVKH